MLPVIGSQCGIPEDTAPFTARRFPCGNGRGFTVTTSHSEEQMVIAVRAGSPSFGVPPALEEVLERLSALSNQLASGPPLGLGRRRARSRASIAVVGRLHEAATGVCESLAPVHALLRGLVVGVVRGVGARHITVPPQALTVRPTSILFSCALVKMSTTFGRH